MTINQAVSLRISDLLIEHNMSQYRLEINSDISHSQLGFIMKNRNNSLNFKTVLKIAKGFDMTIIEFLDCPYFTSEQIDLVKTANR